MSILDHAWLLTRADVIAQRDGFIVTKEDGGQSVIGMVRPDTAAGRTIWRAHASDLSSWAEDRPGAIQRVLDIHNMTEKARLFNLEHPEMRG
ncbi:hypothetical protein SEA_POUND_199 [Mycobacterium phage Pound]|uniref:Uncharacterized protein n=1 Tax=Acinetobacter baumannii TaxID=470 RepID=A0AAJ0VL97_ACIBA|nr:hypothetical protein SEA_DMPSTRDIVER_209 [Mycobacterium phage DmpstrDiver]KZA06972.1 hypothetical protein LV35_04229 [Acinetobacter baumannii]QQM15354.1 hypothetical protein SEA_POUND_199 [Mycobacterium phage Pound]